MSKANSFAIKVKVSETTDSYPTATKILYESVIILVNIQRCSYTVFNYMKWAISDIKYYQDAS